MTPPRLRGLVDKFERAIRVQMRAKTSEKTEVKHAVNVARLELLKAISIIGGARNDA